MTTTKPYLIRAIREWTLDNGLTPQLLVDAGADGVDVPRSHVRDGQIVLNISDQAVVMQEMGNQVLRFSARFDNKSYDVAVPVDGVIAIYARENNQGLFFGAEETGGADTDSTDSEARPKPNLTLVK